MRAKKLLVALVCASAIATPTAFASAGSVGSVNSEKSSEPAAEKQASSADTTETPGPSKELLAWSETVECGACHTSEAESADNEAAIYSAHAALISDCTTCHFDDILIKRHAKATTESKMPKMVKRSEVHDETCTTCHNTEKLAEATADLKTLVDSKDTVVNPHELPQVEDHADITCSSCHKMHSDETAPSEKAQKLCTSCHHADVFECGTCH